MSSGQMRSNERNKSSSAVARDSAVGRGLKNSARASCKEQAQQQHSQASRKWRKQQPTAASESCTVADIAVVLLHTLLLVATTISV
jgi:hypothetical protein